MHCPYLLEINLKKAIANILPMMFILVLAGCNLPGKAAPEPGTVAPKATSQPESAIAAPTVIPTTIPEPLPSGYTDLLQNKIASGEWTLEVGLVTMLRLFAGEIQAGEAGLGQGVKETEGTGILLLAGNYLQTGTDQATKDEITRLINVLVPTQEALDRYSIPEEQATIRMPGPADGAGKQAAPVRQGEDCDDLWASTFSGTGTPTYPCFLFGEQIIAGNAYRVYYPLAWYGDANHDFSYYKATQEAVQKAITKFKVYGAIRPIYFVFNTFNRDQNLYALTLNAFRPEVEACPVMIYPLATALDQDNFQQIVAHEIFHCFQAWNLPDQYFKPGDDAAWWVEGSAEYFSNVVYPGTDFEYRFVEEFSELSKFNPLTDMSYENFVFFQSMGNRVGPEGVIAMLSTMPTAPGPDLQLAALAAVLRMEDTFEGFVRSILDNTLIDTNKSPMNIPIKYTGEVSLTTTAKMDFSGQPFVFARYLVTFDSEKNFEVETLPDGTGRSAWRPRELVGGWSPFPATTSGGCEELPYILYVITTTPGGERKESITATLVSEAPCDKCVVGRWESTNDSILSYMQSILPSGEDSGMTVQSATGVMFMDFKEDGTGAGGYENLKVHQIGVGSAEGSEAFVTFHGTSSGPYTADGSSLIGLNETIDMSVAVDVIVNGISVGSSTIPFRPEDFPIGSAIPTPYTCDGNTLTTWPPVEGATVEPITWTRTSP